MHPKAGQAHKTAISGTNCGYWQKEENIFRTHQESFSKRTKHTEQMSVPGNSWREASHRCLLNVHGPIFHEEPLQKSTNSFSMTDSTVVIGTFKPWLLPFDVVTLISSSRVSTHVDFSASCLPLLSPGANGAIFENC